ncbi:MAG: radical SAM protein [Nitrospirota bacterium]
MKCALIIPAWVPEEIFSSKTAGSQINYWQPLGTLYVASSILKAGHDVKFLNGAFMTHSEILQNVSEYKPDFVGLYSTAFGWKKAVQTASDIRQIFKDVFIAVGGPYPIAMQEKCLTDSKDIDAVVTGEGELTVVEMIERLSHGESLAGVEGVIFRDVDRIVKNPPRSLITDLDSLPLPARELLGNAINYIPPPATYRRKPVAVIITSRGCNRRCIFCFQIDKERKHGVRYRSVENVMQEIELCLRQGYREIKFIDDTLAADYDRAMQIAKEIKARKLDFTWFASACVNQVDKPLLKAFKDAGCWAILFGAESGVQKNLNAIRKGITLEQIRIAVKAAKEVGLIVYTPFIFGIPGETFEEGLKTIEFACELNPDIANFHALTPFPGTELYDNLDKYGRISDDLIDFTYQGAAFIPYSMTRKEIAELRQIAFKRFYSRPKFIFRRALSLRNINDVKAAAKGFKSLFWLWAKKGIFKASNH